MSIFLLFVSLIGANLGIVLVGGAIQLLTARIFRFNRTNTQAFTILSSIVIFASVGIASSFIVTRFLENPDRIDWIWYAVAFFNVPPDPSRGRSNDYGLLCLITVVTYGISCALLKFL